MNKPTPPEVQKAILIVGQLVGLSMNFDADALEKWLDSKPEGFNYEWACRAAIAFKRAAK